MIKHIDYWKKLFELHNIPFNYNSIKDKCNGVFNIPKNNNINIAPKYQIGGDKIVQEILSYGKKKITVFKTTEENRITYSLKQFNKDEMAECLLIEIEFNTSVVTTKENKTVAYIASIHNNNNCYYYESDNKINGSVLIDIAIALVKSKRKEYGITAIYLKDNADKSCKGIPAKRMTIAYTLLTGETWYGSKGFMPFDLLNNKKIDVYKELYEKNIGLDKVILVKHVKNLKQLIYDSYRKYKNYTIDNKYVLANINTKKLLEISDDQFNDRYGNENLGKFPKYLLDNKLINCYIYFNFVDDIFRNTSIEIKYKDSSVKFMDYYDFYGKAFYLDI